MAQLHKYVKSCRTQAGRSSCQITRRRAGGFTLIELMVVIAIIAILGTLLLPTLSRSRQRAMAVKCISNHRQLLMAWMMYSSDYNGKLVYNLGGNPKLRTFAPTTSPNWVNNILDWNSGPNSDNTNLAFANVSLLAPYTSYSAAVFHCPSDRALSGVQQNSGWDERVRSIAMNAMVGDPGNLLRWGTVNVNNPKYQQFMRESDFPEPGGIFVFLDEHPDSVSDGYFLNTPDTPQQWVDLPGSYHNKGGTFAFADGHTEIHRWHDASTLLPPRPNVIPWPYYLHPDQLTDFNWVINHTSVDQ